MANMPRKSSAVFPQAQHKTIKLAISPAEAKSGWSLYWVSSDGEEDCFVVARNSRSAQRVETHYCGFERGDVQAIRVKSISQKTLKQWQSHRKKHRHVDLPWYADKWLLQHLGADFRERDSLSETLIDDVVYTRGGYGDPIPPRKIGRKGLEEFWSVKAFQRYGRKDRYSPSQMALFQILGICLARIQEIEELMANSFILGSIVKSEREKNPTVSELIDSWKCKTMGQMLKAIEGAWTIDPTVHQCLRLFLSMRNKFVHGLTTSPQYDIQTNWGQDELVNFLATFEMISRPIREAFKSTVYASIDVGNKLLLHDEPGRQLLLTIRQKKKIALFAAFFTPKDTATKSLKINKRVSAIEA